MKAVEGKNPSHGFFMNRTHEESQTSLKGVEIRESQKFHGGLL